MMLSHRTGFALCVCAFSYSAPAQYFAPVGPGVSYESVSRLLEDTLSNSLYIAGNFQGTRDTSIASPGILRWDGTSYSAVGCGFDNDCVPSPNWSSVYPVQGLAIWNSELYACGEFLMANNNTLNFIARFDGTTWQPLAGGMDGPVRSVRAYPDGLYAAGWFTYADTVQANGLARWDGTQWHRVHNLPLLDSLTGINFINDVARIGDDVYVGGNFDSQPNTAIYSIAKFNGTSWVPLGNGFRGTYAQVLRLEAHDSLLYVAGAFADQGPYGNLLNPASGIVAYDGEDWVQLGTGTDGSNIPWVIDMAWHNDTLYVCGDFDRMGDVPANKLAYWDGHRWCSLLPSQDQYVGGGTKALAFFRDSLYLGGGFGYIGTDTIYRVAKWIGGDHVEECGVPLEVEQVNANLQALLIYPNPAHDLISFAWPASAVAVVVIDMQGRPIARINQRTTTVDVSALATGSYTLRLLDHEGATLSRARFIKW